MAEDVKLPMVLESAGAPLDPARAEAVVRGKFLPKLWKVVGRIPFSEEVTAAYYAARDPLTPGRVKGVLFAALAYFVVPADMIPDVVAGLGFTDDATVLATAMGLVGAHVKDRHMAAARALLGRGA